MKLRRRPNSLAAKLAGELRQDVALPAPQLPSTPQRPSDILQRIIASQPSRNSLAMKHLLRYWSPPRSLRGTAEVLGSPVGYGKLGNGPGVGFSGAGTQRNFFGRGASGG